MRHVNLPFCVPLLLLGSCGWVDATGVQSGDRPLPIPVVLDDFAPGEPVPLIEKDVLRLRVTGALDETDVYRWSEEALDEGALDVCATVEGFRPELAAATLAEACADGDACEFSFERDANAEAGELAYFVTAPVLRSSVGIRHELSVQSADGNTGASIREFCLIAVNEAPDAVDDGPFTVIEGTTFTVGGPGDPNNLLANDTDDDDAGNQGLVVDTTPLSPPSASDAFELGSDGSFSYTFEDAGIRGSFIDSFEYTITDGVFDPVKARVTLTIVPSNLPPTQALPIEPIEAFVGAPLEVSIAGSFGDPEGGALTFAVRDESSLPPSGSLVLGEDGVLFGAPLPADVGDYDVRFVVSDGVRETEGRVALAVLEPPNQAPTYVAGSSVDLTLTRLARVSQRLAAFVDPDGDALSYELIGVPPRGLIFNEATGVLSGVPRVRGISSGFQVRAVDPSGAAGFSIVFSIQVV